MPSGSVRQARAGVRLVLRDVAGRLQRQDGPSSTPIAAAFTPADIQKAYNLKGLKSHGRTVAIVDAFCVPDARERPGLLPGLLQAPEVHDQHRLPDRDGPGRRPPDRRSPTRDGTSSRRSTSTWSPRPAPTARS